MSDCAAFQRLLLQLTSIHVGLNYINFQGWGKKYGNKIHCLFRQDFSKNLSIISNKSRIWFQTLLNFIHLSEIIIRKKVFTATSLHEKFLKITFEKTTTKLIYHLFKKNALNKRSKLIPNYHSYFLQFFFKHFSNIVN